VCRWKLQSLNWVSHLWSGKKTLTVLLPVIGNLKSPSSNVKLFMYPILNKSKKLWPNCLLCIRSAHEMFGMWAGFNIYVQMLKGYNDYLIVLALSIWMDKITIFQFRVPFCSVLQKCKLSRNMGKSYGIQKYTVYWAKCN
jgi:hypothetical protein